MFNAIKRVLGAIGNLKLASWLQDIAISGFNLGLDTAQKDTRSETPFEPDMESILRIGIRTHALSEKTIARAKGNLAFNADKLYQEMDAAMRRGMSKREALLQIQGRLRNLFTDSLEEWELERLARDQFLVATKEGRRTGWEKGGMKYRQWKIHLDDHTAADSKRMEGQIVGINEPYTDPLTGEKYMLPHMRPNDRCWEIGLWELPVETVERDGIIFAKGGEGSGIVGHTTYKKMNNFERNIRTAQYEIGGLFDKEGKVLFIADGTNKEITFTPKQKEIFFSGKGSIFTHNHPSGGSFSWPDINASCKGNLKEVRVVGKEYSYSLKIKKEVDKLTLSDMKKKNNELFRKSYYHYAKKISNGTMTSRAALIAASHDTITMFVRFYPEYFGYERTLEIKKGGPGSGRRGHRTPKKIMYAHKKIREYERKIAKLPMERALAVDNKGNTLFEIFGNQNSFIMTPRQGALLRKTKGTILTHNHPSGNSFSRDDIFMAGKNKVSEMRAIGISYTYVAKLDKGFSPEDMFAEHVRAYNKHYPYYSEKVFYKQMTAHEASMEHLDIVWKEIDARMDTFHYERRPNVSFTKGGEGSGIVGHRTIKEDFKQKYAKGLQNIQNFEKRVINSRFEWGCLVNSEGDVLFITHFADSPNQVSFTIEETELFKKGKENNTNLIFSHNHPNSAGFSDNDIISLVNYNLREVRAVGSKYTYSIKLKHPINEEKKKIIFEDISCFQRQISMAYSQKISSGEMTSDEANLLWSDEWVSKLAKIHFNSFEYVRTITNKDIAKGGPGSGVKGHKTYKEEPKAYRIIQKFEEMFRDYPYENCFAVDGNGEPILRKSGGERSISFTEDEILNLNLADDVVFSHNHPEEYVGSFSLEDIKFAISRKLKEIRAVTKEYTYIMTFNGKILLDFVEKEYDKEYKTNYFLVMEKVENKNITNKQGSDELFHNLWKNVSETIPEFSYKRIKAPDFQKK